MKRNKDTLFNFLSSAALSAVYTPIFYGLSALMGMALCQFTLGHQAHIDNIVELLPWQFISVVLGGFGLYFLIDLSDRISRWVGETLAGDSE